MALVVGEQAADHLLRLSLLPLGHRIVVDRVEQKVPQVVHVPADLLALLDAVLVGTVFDHIGDQGVDALGFGVAQLLL